MGEVAELLQNQSMALNENATLCLAGRWQNEDSPVQSLGIKGKKNNPTTLAGLGHSSNSRNVSHCAAVLAETGYALTKMKCSKRKFIPLIAVDFVHYWYVPLKL